LQKKLKIRLAETGVKKFAGMPAWQEDSWLVGWHISEGHAANPLFKLLSGKKEKKGLDKQSWVKILVRFCKAEIFLSTFCMVGKK
jgi:hypothetical protein